VLALAAVLATAAHGAADDKTADTKKPEQVAKPIKLGKKDRLNAEKMQMAKDLLQVKKDELKVLQSEAESVTAGLGELAKSGKVLQDEESLKTMQTMVDELKAIRERLDKMQEEIEAIQGWIEGQNENLPIMQQDLATLKSHKEGNYVQFQYQDTNRKGGAFDAFRLRRVRVGFTETIAPNASMKVSFDLATGTSQTSAQLKDAFLTYDIRPSDVAFGTSAIAGQQNIPLGYEIERSSSDREFPERAQYNQIMFNGERGRGVQLRHGLGKNALVYAGVFNALSVNDPEQANLAPGPGNRLAGTGGVRFFGPKYELGVSGWFGKRTEYTSGTPAVTSPEVDRRFIYLDGTYVGLLSPNLFLRAEAMFGKDRVPNATARADRFADDMFGYHVLLGYNLNSRNVLSFRYEEFNPTRDRDGDLIRGYGLSFNHYLSPSARLTLAHEWFQDDARAGAPNNQRKYHMTTLRLQYKF
jgi:hypothetical protein